jgi:hypothetical protein
MSSRKAHAMNLAPTRQSSRSKSAPKRYNAASVAAANSRRRKSRGKRRLLNFNSKTLKYAKGSKLTHAQQNRRSRSTLAYGLPKASARTAVTYRRRSPVRHRSHALHNAQASNLASLMSGMSMGRRRN